MRTGLYTGYRGILVQKMSNCGITCLLHLLQRGVNMLDTERIKDDGGHVLWTVWRSSVCYRYKTVLVRICLK